MNMIKNVLYNMYEIWYEGIFFMNNYDFISGQTYSQL